MQEKLSALFIIARSVSDVAIQSHTVSELLRPAYSELAMTVYKTWYELVGS